MIVFSSIDISNIIALTTTEDIFHQYPQNYHILINFYYVNNFIRSTFQNRHSIGVASCNIISYTIVICGIFFCKIRAHIDKIIIKFIRDYIAIRGSATVDTDFSNILPVIIISINYILISFQVFEILSFAKLICFIVIFAAKRIIRVSLFLYFFFFYCKGFSFQLSFIKWVFSMDQV